MTFFIRTLDQGAAVPQRDTTPLNLQSNFKNKGTRRVTNSAGKLSTVLAAVGAPSRQAAVKGPARHRTFTYSNDMSMQHPS